jgi:hypothetical protein
VADFFLIIIVILIGLLIICALLKGIIKTFKRQPVVAILCVIFLLPIYLIWAIVEIFTNDPNEEIEEEQIE